MSTFDPPRRHSSSNDDVRIETFQPPDIPRAGRHRKGAREPLDDCSSLSERISAALRGDSPYAAATPLPRGTMRAALFTRDIPFGQLVRFRKVQIAQLPKLVEDPRFAQSKWDDCAPDSPRPAAGKLQMAALKHLTASQKFV